jgi:hypothetical protein
MAAIFQDSIDIDDPLFGALEDDPTIGKQMAQIALDTPPGSLDAFPEYGFSFNAEILKAHDTTEVQFLPLEIRTALEAEPAFVTADVAINVAGQGPGPTVALEAACSITAAEGDQVDFAAPLPTG